MLALTKLINDDKLSLLKGGIAMGYPAPGRCPVCQNTLTVTGLACEHCRTRLEGEFQPCKFCQLPDEQRLFLEVFVKNRGNIKDVEKELGISYPTVRNRLDLLIEALGYRIEDAGLVDDRGRRQEILQALENGDITPEEAGRQLRKGK